MQLWWCSLLHIINDGQVVGLALLLPFIAADLDLSYTQSGLLKSANQIAISVAQIPAGLLAERFGEILVLGLGTAWFSLGHVALIAAFSYPLVLILVLVAGLGGGAYHPVGTALIANVFPPEKSGPAIGTLNFSGDVGKVLFPALAGFLVVHVGWQGSFAVLGGIGAGGSLCYLFFCRRALFRPRPGPPPAATAPDPEAPATTFRARLTGWGIRQPGRFTLYVAIGFLDVAIRTAVMAFLGFLLLATGVEKGAIGWFMSLTFLGGAGGKFLCGMPIQKLGPRRIILFTELMMILGCWALPSIPPGWGMVLFLPLFGFMLNGTSSVIYIGLAPTFQAERRSRGYALYYTLNFFSAAAAPFLFGLVGDGFGLAAIFYVAGALMFLGLPLVAFLRDS